MWDEIRSSAGYRFGRRHSTGIVLLPVLGWLTAAVLAAAGMLWVVRNWGGLWSWLPSDVSWWAVAVGVLVAVVALVRIVGRRLGFFW